MIGIGYYLVHSDKIYEDEIVTKSGFRLFVGNVRGTMTNLTRMGEIIAVKQGNPLGLEIGDTVVCHWNIFKEFIDYKHTVNPSPFCFDQVNKRFYVSEDLIYGVIRDGKFQSVGNYCFIKPDVSYKPEKMDSGLIIPENAREKVDQVKGTLKYSCPDLEERGMKEGDTVYFTEDSDIVFNIMGEDLYRMEAEWIIAYEYERA